MIMLILANLFWLALMLAVIGIVIDTLAPWDTRDTGRTGRKGR